MVPQPQPSPDRTQLKELIARCNDPEAFLSDVADILQEMGVDTKHRVANLVEKDPLLAQWANRDLCYSEAILQMLDDISYED